MSVIYWWSFGTEPLYIGFEIYWTLSILQYPS